MKVALPGGAGFAGIDDDPPSAIVTLLPEIFVEDRKGLGTIRPREDQHLSKRYVAPRVGCPVDTKRLIVPGPGRHHAEPPVVVDVTSAESDPGKLAHYIGFLGRKR